jgi:hypothetical protein
MMFLTKCHIYNLTKILQFMKTRLFLQAATAALVLAACSSEENATSNSGPADGKLAGKADGGIAQLQSRALENLTQKFTFDTRQETASFTTKSGVKISLNPSRLTKKGQPVSGTVTLEYAEILGLGGMVTANKTTLGVAGEEYNPEDPNVRQLVSGGEFYVNVTQEGEGLDDAPYQVTVPTDLTSEQPDDDMTAWEGQETENGDVVWTEDTNDEGQPNTVHHEEGSYILNFREFGWSNIDRFRADTGPMTMLYVDVPAGFDNSNARVYFATPGDNLCAPLDIYDATTELFSEHTGLVPVGINAYVIFVAEDAGNWVYTVKNVTIAANSTVTIDASDLVTATETDVIDFLNSLP